MSKYETAPYKVVKKEADFEIRLYDTFYTATINQNSYDANGFNQIFQYISGDNQRGEKISMTTPVINELSERVITTEFVMPRSYTSETLPKPKNNAIQIKKSESKYSASVTFSGTVNDHKIKDRQDRLLAWLKANNIKPTGSFRLARYNSPFT